MSAAGRELKAISSQRSAQSGLPEIFVSISKLCMNSTMPQVSNPWRGIGVAGAAVLVAGEPAAGELAVQAHDRLVIPLGGIQEFRVARLLVIHAGLAESLGDVDVVPIDDAGVPPGHVVVDFPAQIEQPGLAGAVVEPVGGFDGVAEADLGPIAAAEGFGRLGVEPLEVLGHERHDAFIAAVFVERLEDVEHDHVRPEVGVAVEAGLVGARAEVAVGFLAGKGGVNPLAGALDDRFVLEDVAEVAVALEPVRQLFPAELALALGARPRRCR